MTKKRFKLSMAALGLLAAFFMVLLALLLAPNLASANRDARMLHHAKPGAGYPHGGSGSHGFAANSNESGHDHGNAFDAPFCVDDGVYPCTVLGDTEDAFDGAGGYSDRYENGYGGGGNPQGGSLSNGNGPYSTNFWGQSGAPGGGAGGGGAPSGGVGGGHDDDKVGTDESSNPDSEQDSGEPGTDDPIPGLKVTDFAPPGDDGQPSDFVDPDFGGDEPNTEDDPKGEEPPITEVTVTEVPEPLTLSLFAVGLAGAAQLRRRSRQSRQK